MPTFIMLNKLTDQGAKSIKDTTKRHATAKKHAAKYGVKVKEFFWTLGNYDVIGVYEAPDAESMAAFTISVAAAGNVQTQLLRALDEAEMKSVLAKVDG
jgi:uncharacterized protein with GYD domain